MNASFTDPFGFSLTLVSGKSLDLSPFRGRPLLIINTATRCGLAGQFAGLEQLHQEFGPRGLRVIGIPSDQFAHQEPETNDTVAQVCQRNHGVTFPLTQITPVNGPETPAFLELLKRRAPGFLGSRDIKWNFTKFLVSPDGRTIRRFAPTTPPDQLRRAIEGLLS